MVMVMPMGTTTVTATTTMAVMVTEMVMPIGIMDDGDGDDGDGDDGVFLPETCKLYEGWHQTGLIQPMLSRTDSLDLVDSNDPAIDMAVGGNAVMPSRIVAVAEDESSFIRGVRG